MKSLKFYAVLLFSMFTAGFSFAQKNTSLNKKETIKVLGNCESCKKRIETTAKAAGAVTASWNEENEMLEVSYDGGKTSAIKIEQAIAAKGHDTQDVKATDKAYNKLPGCCKYDRSKLKEVINN